MLFTAWKHASVEEQQAITGQQAITLFDLYDKGLVFWRYRAVLDGLRRVLNRIDEPGRILLPQNSTEEMTPLKLALNDALYSLGSGQMYFTSAEGLQGVPNEKGDLKITCPKVEEIFDNDNPELAIAKDMGLTHYADQFDLRWKEGIPFPLRLSDRCHSALGVLGANDQFEYVLSVLSEDHPARWPDIR